MSSGGGAAEPSCPLVTECARRKQNVSVIMSGHPYKSHYMSNNAHPRVVPNTTFWKDFFFFLRHSWMGVFFFLNAKKWEMRHTSCHCLWGQKRWCVAAHGTQFLHALVIYISIFVLVHASWDEHESRVPPEEDVEQSEDGQV